MSPSAFISRQIESTRVGQVASDGAGVRLLRILHGAADQRCLAV